MLRTFWLFIVKQEAMLPSTAWNDNPEVIAWDEWPVGRPETEFPIKGQMQILD